MTRPGTPSSQRRMSAIVRSFPRGERSDGRHAVARAVVGERHRLAGGHPAAEHRTDEGKLYLCAIKDVHSNRIVGYSLDSRMTADLAVTALPNAVSLRDNPVGVVVHSDRA